MSPFGRRGLTSREDSELLVAPGPASCLPPENYVFSGTLFSAFFGDLLAKMIPKCAKMCDFGTSRATLCRLFIVFSPNLFFIETIVFYYVLGTFTHVR